MTCLIDVSSVFTFSSSCSVGSGQSGRCWQGCWFFMGSTTKISCACQVRGGYYHCVLLRVPVVLINAWPPMACYPKEDGRQSWHLGVTWLYWTTSNVKKAGICHHWSGDLFWIQLCILIPAEFSECLTHSMSIIHDTIYEWGHCFRAKEVRLSFVE